MKKKSTIHVWLLLLLGLGGLAGVGWYAHASSPPVSQLMPVLGDAYGPVVDNLDKVIKATRQTEPQAGSNSTAVAGGNVADAAAGSSTDTRTATMIVSEQPLGAESESDRLSQVVATTDQLSTDSSTSQVSGDAGSNARNGVTANAGTVNGIDSGNAASSANPVDSDATAVVAGDADADSLNPGLRSNGSRSNKVSGENVLTAVSPNGTDDLATRVIDATTYRIESDQSEQDQSGSDRAVGIRVITAATASDATENNVDSPDSVLATLRETELALLDEYVDDITFTAERWSLNETTRGALSNIFETLFLYSEVNLAMDVHVTDTDDSALNQVISEQRASAILGYLMDRGLASDRVQIRGQGDTAQKNNLASVEVTTVSGVTLRQLNGENQ